MKMQLFTTFILLLLFTACNEPRGQRKSSTEGGSFIDFGPQSNGPTGNSGNESGGSTTSGSQVPSEISHCQWSQDGVNGFSDTSSHLGSYTLCQSSTTETEIYIQIKTPITDSALCFIPTNSTSSGASRYIGEVRCLNATDSKKIYKVTLVKNRPSPPGGASFSQYPLNSVMVMKDKAYFFPAPFYVYQLAPDAYIKCSTFLDYYQDPSYCDAFKQVGQYVFKVF